MENRQQLVDVPAAVEGAGEWGMLKLPSLGELDQGMAVRIYPWVQPADFSPPELVDLVAEQAVKTAGLYKSKIR